MPALSLSIAQLALLVSAAQVQAGAGGAGRPSIDPWQVTELTDQPSVTLELQALNTVPSAVFKVRPILLVRCQEHELEVLVSTGLVLGADGDFMTPVRIEWGAENPKETRWNRSTDSTSAFAPDPRAFLPRFVSNPDLLFEIRPAGTAPQLIRFNGRGLERHLAQVDAACPPNGKGDPMGGHVFGEDGVDEPPQIVSTPPLEYPPLLREGGVQGRVTMQAIVDTSGRAEPSSLKIIARPSTGFEQSARDYMLHTVFRPGRVNGRAVRVRVRVPIDYKIP
ncbi:MAG TPA: TonB family protein [Gemmatimonadales bacterium]|nr:TonB family protein [Gemmatimonadales bacterium]